MLLSPDFYPQAASLLAEAFHTNPPHVYIFPDVAKRAKQMAWLMPRNVVAQARSCRGFCRVDDGRLQVMGFWQAPGAPDIRLTDMIRVGLLKAPLALGLGATGRALAILDAIDRQREQALRGAKAWCLHNFAVQADLRGRGLGGRTLTEEIANIRHQDPGATIVLETQKPENIRFYRALGFEILDVQELGSGPARFENTVLRQVASNHEFDSR